MALDNTNARYNYIYGNNVRKLDADHVESGQTVRKKKHATVPAKQKQQEEARKQRALQRSNAFDWKYTAIVMISVVVCAASALLYVGETAYLNRLTTQVTQLKNEKTRLQGKHAALQAEINKAVNLDEIRDYAENELKMTYPDKKHVIYYESGSDDYFFQYDRVVANK